MKSGRESKNSCLIPEKHVTSLLCIVIKTIQSTNFSEKRIIVNNNQFQGLTEPTLSRTWTKKNSSQPKSGKYRVSFCPLYLTQISFYTNIRSAFIA